MYPTVISTSIIMIGSLGLFNALNKVRFKQEDFIEDDSSNELAG